MNDTHGEQSKFQTGSATPAIDSDELPWGYGEDRITAMVRDSESAYVYWEITDPGIAAARARLGPAGAHGWCNLRVYDTTGRDFNGTNANDYFDIGIDRGDRDYFLMIRRPGSSLHVEVGIKTHEGYFQPVARSGRADFPRSGPSPDTRLEWMTVTSDDAPPCVTPYRSRYGGAAPALPAREGGGYVDVWRTGYAPAAERDAPVREQASWSTHPVGETRYVERWWNVDEWRAEWRSGLRFLRLEHLDPQRIALDLLGEVPTHVQVDDGEMVIYGPWRVTILDIASEEGRRVLSTWTMRWVKATTPMIESWQQATSRRSVASWGREHVTIGASDAIRRLLGGASEVIAIGGSERMWMGASEWVAAGASELRWIGASELFRVAASGKFGASEHLGASERLGASEHAGGSDAAGASETLSSASGGERWGGRIVGGA